MADSVKVMAGVGGGGGGRYCIACDPRNESCKKGRELECISFPRSKKSVSVNKLLTPKYVIRWNFAVNLIQSPDHFSGQFSLTLM